MSSKTFICIWVSTPLEHYLTQPVCPLRETKTPLLLYISGPSELFFLNGKFMYSAEFVLNQVSVFKSQNAISRAGVLVG